MKRTIVFAVLLALPVLAAGEDTRAPQKPDVVEAAKQAKAKRKSSTTKVITNADVKKAKSKLIVRDAAPSTTVDVTAEKKSALEEQNSGYHARVAASAVVAENEKKVAALEKDLEAIEQRYYEENDPNYRDNVIQKRFAQAKRQLEDARRDLADARDALAKTQEPHP